MSLLGDAALAMWWDMAPAIKSEFEDWHSHEHFPERLGVPGFRRASRWTCAEGGEGIFVLYELTSWAVERGQRLTGIEVARPTLEDVYLELTGAEEGRT